MHQVKISEINISPIKPNNGLVAFASCIYEDSLYLGSIAVHTRLGGGYRLVYPKQSGIDTFHPIRGSIGSILEKAISEKYINLLK